MQLRSLWNARNVDRISQEPTGMERKEKDKDESKRIDNRNKNNNNNKNKTDDSNTVAT